MNEENEGLVDKYDINVGSFECNVFSEKLEERRSLSSILCLDGKRSRLKFSLLSDFSENEKTKKRFEKYACDTIDRSKSLPSCHQPLKPRKPTHTICKGCV